MTVDLHKETQELVADYYNKDKWYARLTLTLVTILTLIAAYFLFTQFQNSNRNQAVIKDLVAQIKVNQDASDKKILDHLDCIGLFLSQPNRAVVRIEDLQNCKISSNGVAINEPSNAVTPMPQLTPQNDPTDMRSAETPPTPPQRSFISPAVDALNKVIKGGACFGKVCI